jgi:hypothetical protein
MIVYSVALLFDRVLDYSIINFTGIIIKGFGSPNPLRHEYFFASFSNIGLAHPGPILHFSVHELVYYLPMQKQGRYEHLEIFSICEIIAKKLFFPNNTYHIIKGRNKKAVFIKLFFPFIFAYFEPISLPYWLCFFITKISDSSFKDFRSNST